MDIQSFSSFYSAGNGAYLCAGIIFFILLVGFGIYIKVEGLIIDLHGLLQIFMISTIIAMFGGLGYGGLVNLPAKIHAQGDYMEEFKSTLVEKGFTLVEGNLPFENYGERTIKLEKDGEFSLCEVTDPKDSDMLSFKCMTLGNSVNLETLVTK